jgi:hypothetical protein
LDLTELSPGTTYYFVVRARNPVGEEDSNTAEVSATTCLSGHTACIGTCVSTTTDPANCGACGNACPSGFCASGQCCGSGQIACDGACSSTQTDPCNCGACGNTCATGLCANGQCCGSGQTTCNGACTSMQTDASNCGACGNTCATGLCANGQCCGSGQTLCNGACTSTQADANNCGARGNTCPVGEVCSIGQCGALCSGNQDCPQFESCLGSVCRCVTIVPSLQLALCGTQCVAIHQDNANCFACGHMCPAGSTCSAASGGCVYSCSPPLAACNGLFNPCVDTSSDPLNCGTCGTVCAAGQTCRTGLCVM